ncbi:MAG: histidine triad nucleotide-binding protein [Candidatus Pelagibacterales bacterium]|jgi:histidine triad (HIT) family protein|tara:strand:- start:234 stop:617 length:384 start_codon:yes stop_codon:yes gene_type:complete
MSSYDNQNIFAKILRGEIPCDKIYEDDYVLSFKDISPQAPSHILVIPKGPYKDINDFSKNANNEELIGFNRAISIIADQLKLSEESGGKGYRLISNAGSDSHQEVPHLHIHLLAGRKLGPMLIPEKS